MSNLLTAAARAKTLVAIRLPAASEDRPASAAASTALRRRSGLVQTKVTLNWVDGVGNGW
jgi:hypothetical protein